MVNTKIMSFGLITALLLSTTAASAQTAAQAERVPGVRPTFDEGRAYGPKVPGVHPVLGAQTSYPSGSPVKTASQVSAPASGSNSLLGILGLGAGLALLAGAAGGGSDDGDSGGAGSGGTSWLDQGPGTEPDPSYRGEILTLLKRSGFSESAFIALVNGGARASDAQILSVRQDERYLRNPALVQANFANKLALGLTGSGVKVGVFDSGIIWDNKNLKDRLRGEGYAGFTGADTNRNRHGTQVANVLAGYSEDTVSRGIAPGVELHDIMVAPHDTDVPKFRLDNFGGAFDYIVDNRLDIVNMSLASSVSAGGDLRAKSVSHLGGLTDDFRRATRNGTIFVVAAGNDANIPTVNSYAGLGIDPDIGRGQILTVYSLAENGQELSIRSNTCGQTMYSCIGAVGERLPVVAYAGNESRFSGTSAATPVVSGALALLKEQNPELSSAQLVELVLFTATDMGERGVDEVYGRGILNMDRASVPVGGLRVVTGQTIDSPVISNQELSVNVSQGMVSLASVLDDKVFTGLDAFDRAFPIAASDYVSVKKGSLDNS